MPARPTAPRSPMRPLPLLLAGGNLFAPAAMAADVAGGGVFTLSGLLLAGGGLLAGLLVGRLAGPALAGSGMDWEAPLANWARQQLHAGVADVHAQARQRLDTTLLEVALELTGGRRAEAASRLGVGRNTLTRKLGASRHRG